MSLSKRGQMRASLVAPGGPLHGYFQSIKNEWRPDDTSGVCRLDIAESDLMHTELADSFRTLTALGAPTSVGGVNASSSNRLLTSLATLFNEQWSPKTPVLPSQIIAGAGCSILIEYLVHAICDPGDVVLTPAPFWPVFSTLVSKAGVGISVLPCLPASHANSIQASVVEELANIMTWTDATLQQWDSHVAQLLAAGKPPRALLLSNPLNPLGRCYSKSALTKAAEFCEKHDLLLISDEVFALSMHADALRSSWFSNSSAHGRGEVDDHTYSPSPFHSILSLDLDKDRDSDTAAVRCDRSRIVMLWSVSKDFAASGARMAAAVVPHNLMLMAALSSYSTAFRVSSFADNFFSEFLTASQSVLTREPGGAEGTEASDSSGMGNLKDARGADRSIVSWFAKEHGKRLEEARKRVCHWCLSRGIVVFAPEAGHCLMIYLGSYLEKRYASISTPLAQGLGGSDLVIPYAELEKQMSAHLLHHGVALQAGMETCCPRPGWFRMTFARGPDYMMHALERLDSALHSW